jgi:multidrug transporter EmrE-like cation transporter
MKKIGTERSVLLFIRLVKKLIFVQNSINFWVVKNNFLVVSLNTVQISVFYNIFHILAVVLTIFLTILLLIHWLLIFNQISIPASIKQYQSV